MSVKGHARGTHRNCGAALKAYKVVVFQEPHWTFYHAGMLVTNCPSCGQRLRIEDLKETREEPA